MRYTTPKGALYAPYLIEMIEGNHTLIAGTVGAGKSVLENSIIYALLATHFPGTVSNGKGARFVLLDPKKVELDCYKNLPHTWIYADTLPDIEKALFSVRRLIDSRLNDMKKHGQRKSTNCPVYVFIDELVDLVTNKQYGKEIVRLLSDIASISRAAGVFICALTQSPARVIIPAQFKLLFNCRVALRCNNSIESRQIIDDDSAVSLPLHGVGVVQQNLDRYMIEIPMYSDRDINKMVAFWNKQHRFIRQFRKNYV